MYEERKSGLIACPMTRGSLSKNPLIFDLIKRSLVIEVSRAESERGFSYLSQLVNRQRFQFLPTTVENLVRVYLNGPDDLMNFYPRKYSKLWLKKHHLVDTLYDRTSGMVDEEVERIEKQNIVMQNYFY